MTTAEQIAVFCSALVVVLGAIIAAARYVGGRLVRLGRQWHGIQLAVNEAAQQTAKLADELRGQLAEVAARRDEDYRVLSAQTARVDDRLRDHEMWHAQRRGWIG